MVSVQLAIFLLIFPLTMYMILLLTSNHMKLWQQRFFSSNFILFTEYKDQFLNTLFFIARRVIFAGSIVFGYEYPWAQGFVNLLLSVPVVIYSIYCLPFDSWDSMVFEIYNEVNFLAIGILTLPLIDNISNGDARFNLGWIIVALTLTNILLNSIYMLYDIIRSFYYFAVRVRNYLRHRKPLTKEELAERRLKMRKISPVLEDMDERFRTITIRETTRLVQMSPEASRIHSPSNSHTIFMPVEDSPTKELYGPDSRNMPR